MNIVDIAISVLILLFFISGYRKGFTGALFSLLSIITGVISAYLLYKPFSDYLVKVIKSPGVANVISFVIIFIIVNFVVNKLGDYLSVLMKKLYLGWLNSIAGGAIGFAKGFILIGITVFLLNHLDFPLATKEFNESILVPHILYGFNLVFNFAMDSIPTSVRDKAKDFY